MVHLQFPRSSVAFDAPRTVSVGHLKALIVREIVPLYCEFDLVFRGRLLSTERSLAYYRVERGDRIFVVLQAKGACGDISSDHHSSSLGEIVADNNFAAPVVSDEARIFSKDRARLRITIAATRFTVLAAFMMWVALVFVLGERCMFAALGQVLFDLARDVANIGAAHWREDVHAVKKKIQAAGISLAAWPPIRAATACECGASVGATGSASATAGFRAP